MADFSDFLKNKLNADGVLPVCANGEMSYKIRGVCARISVIWTFEAPEGGGESHFSVLRGNKAEILIKQGQEQNFRSELYVNATNETTKTSVRLALANAIANLLTTYPGVE